jgi:hypothetical protein
MANPFRDPRVLPQLDGSATAGADCAFRQAQAAILWVTGTLVGIKAMRSWLQVPAGGIGMASVRRLVEHYAPGATVAYTTSTTVVWQGLALGAYVICAVDYGWVNDNLPAISGDHAFRDDHALGLFGREPVRKRTYTEWHDSLGDNRRANIPKTNSMVRARDANGAMASPAHGVQAVIVQRPA